MSLSAASAPEANTLDSPIIGAARTLLGRRLRVTVSGGRQLSGDFHCLDKQGNLILSNTYEQTAGRESAPAGERFLSMVLVPATERLSCSILVLPREQEDTEELLAVR